MLTTQTEALIDIAALIKAEDPFSHVANRGDNPGISFPTTPGTPLISYCKTRFLSDGGVIPYGEPLPPGKKWCPDCARIREQRYRHSA